MEGMWTDTDEVTDEENYSSNAVLRQNLFFIFFYFILNKISFLFLLFQRENKL